MFWTKIPQGRLLLNKFFLKKSLLCCESLFIFLCNFLCSCVLSSQRFFRDYNRGPLKKNFLLFVFVSLKHFHFILSVDYVLMGETNTRTNTVENHALIKTSVLTLRGDEQVFCRCMQAWPKNKRRGENEEEAKILSQRSHCRFCLLLEHERLYHKQIHSRKIHTMLSCIIASRNFFSKVQEWQTFDN